MKQSHISPRRVPRQAIDIMHYISGKGYIAGGYARWVLLNKKPPAPSDIDIFSYRQDMDYQPVDTDEFEVSSPIIDILVHTGYELVKDLPNAIQIEFKGSPKYRNQQKVQVIKPFENDWMRTYGTPEVVLNQFDFTVAMAAIWADFFHDDWVHSSIEHEDFRKHNKKKRLYIQHINCPIAVSMRVAKYCSKGYFIGPKEIIKLFKEWDSRPEFYRARLIELCEKAELSPTEWWEIEKLLRID